MGAPKVYKGDVIVIVDGTTSFEHVIVEGNLRFVGQFDDNASFSNVTVEGDLDLSELNGSFYNFDGIAVVGETIF